MFLFRAADRQRLDELYWKVEHAIRIFGELRTRVDQIMVTLADIRAAEDAETAEVKAVLVALEAGIAKMAALSDQLAVALAGAADPVAMQAILDEQNANIAAMQAALPASAVP